MATPAQLVEAVSTATGVPLQTVVDIDRKLAKGNLRTIGGRGLSAARMTSLDAARLLTAILASPQANASVDAVERYAKTRIDKARSGDMPFADCGVAELGSLPARHSFVAGLSALIASVATGTLSELTNKGENAAPSIEVFAFTRATRGRIRLADLPGGRTANVEYGAIGSARRQAFTGDLEQSRRITEQTLFAIAHALAGGK